MTWRILELIFNVTKHPHASIHFNVMIRFCSKKSYQNVTTNVNNFILDSAKLLKIIFFIKIFIFFNTQKKLQIISKFKDN